MRDAVMGLPPHDYDVATSAKPAEVKAVFRRLGWAVIPVGERFGVVAVVHPRTGRRFEVATFRIEKYRFGDRRPAEVSFTPSIEDDVRRRDFTVNALAADASGRVLDFVGGLEDIKAGVIRFVGEPRERIAEDPLRMLRAPRFAAKLGFRIEPRSADAIRRHAALIRAIPAERVRDEFLKAAETPRFASFVRACVDLGLMEHIIPELLELRRARHGTKHHHGEDALEHTVEVLERLDAAGAPPELKLAGLLHDIGKRHYAGPSFRGHEAVSAREAGEVMRRLRFPAKTVKFVEDVVRAHMTPHQIYDSMKASGLRKGALARRLAWRYGDITPALLILAACDTSENPEYMLAEAREAEKLLRESKVRPVINGNDIIALAPEVGPGPWVGKVKRELLRIQVERGITGRGELLRIAKELVRKYAGRRIT